MIPFFWCKTTYVFVKGKGRREIRETKGTPEALLPKEEDLNGGISWVEVSSARFALQKKRVGNMRGIKRTPEALFLQKGSTVKWTFLVDGLRTDSPFKGKGRREIRGIKGTPEFLLRKEEELNGGISRVDVSTARFPV